MCYEDPNALYIASITQFPDDTLATKVPVEFILNVTAEVVPKSVVFVSLYDAFVPFQTAEIVPALIFAPFLTK